MCFLHVHSLRVYIKISLAHGLYICVTTDEMYMLKVKPISCSVITSLYILLFKPQVI